MDLADLGRIKAQHEVPEPIKFAWPVVLLPELFATPPQLAILLGYLTTIGWEVYVPDLRAAIGDSSRLAKFDFKDLIAMSTEAIDAIGREVVVIGHGVGGLAALKLSAHRQVKASVAFAPLIPGFRTPLIGGIANRIAAMLGRPINPPRGRMLFELVADLEPFAREALIKSMRPDSGALASDVVRSAIDFTPTNPPRPRLIVAGESDIFAPFDRASKFAESIGASIVKIAGRGHWLIGGRAIERAIHQTQRFLVRALGQDLLLLYPEEWKNEPQE
ncbi:MAG: alpha/beta fold hydrolase [Candidatus Binatus sp.]|uniref:alpha/beta fold hydrolase n=1 Tax=Candidatus Binatus sp. TaxID=2811406 RepID=UPI00271624DE|nr:alpha/beta fold hydrolase [Candidatus Binatus sp.]MDO8431973.1 alpha/beta fold hydrolase [Candidatus Binatus sp.]